MKIGIIVAMGGEFRLVEALLSGKKEQEIRGYRYVTGQLGEKEIVLTQCGIGKVCAAVGTVEMIRYFSPDYILNTGCPAEGDGYGRGERSGIPRCVVWDR